MSLGGSVRPTSGQTSVPSSGDDWTAEVLSVEMELSCSPLWATIPQVPITTSNPMLSWLGALHSGSAMNIWRKLLKSVGHHIATSRRKL